MALDALTVVRVADGEDVWGSHTRANTWQVTLSNSYPTGGYTITPQRFGYKTIRGILQGTINTAAIGYVLQYNTTTGKIVALTGALAQPSANTDLSALTFNLTFLGE